MATLNNQDVFNTVCELATVEFNGDVVTVRTRDLESFKTELVARHTKNASKKRQGDSRFNWLLAQYAQAIRSESHASQKVYLLEQSKDRVLLRNKKGHFLKAAEVFKDQFGSIWTTESGLAVRKIVNGDFAKRGPKAKVEAQQAAVA